MSTQNKEDLYLVAMRNARGWCRWVTVDLESAIDIVNKEIEAKENEYEGIIVNYYFAKPDNAFYKHDKRYIWELKDGNNDVAYFEVFKIRY